MEQIQAPQSKTDNFVEKNARWLMALIFSAGLLYGEFKHVRSVEERLGKKIKVLQDLEEEVNALENRIIVLETIKK